MTERLATAKWMWITPLLPIVLLLIDLLLILIISYVRQLTIDRTGSVGSGDIITTLFDGSAYGMLILLPASILVGIVMLAVILLLCIMQVISFKDTRTLLSIGLACVDVALPVLLFFWWVASLKDMSIVFL